MNTVQLTYTVHNDHPESIAFAAWVRSRLLPAALEVLDAQDAQDAPVRLASYSVLFGPRDVGTRSGIAVSVDGPDAQRIHQTIHDALGGSALWDLFCCAQEGVR